MVRTVPRNYESLFILGLPAPSTAAEQPIEKNPCVTPGPATGSLVVRDVSLSAREIDDIVDKLPAESAIEALGTCGTEVVRPLLRRLESHDTRVVGAVLETLGRVGPLAHSALPNVLTALESRSAAVRWGATFAISSIGPSTESIPKLLWLLGDDSDYRVRAWAGRALIRTKCESHSILSAYVRALSDRTSTVRAVAARGLSETQTRCDAAIPVLTNRLNQKKDPIYVRDVFCYTLERLTTRVEVSLPSSYELQSLPAWAQVGFASRCARLMFHLLPVVWPDVPEDVLQAFQEATIFAETGSKAEWPASAKAASISNAANAAVVAAAEDFTPAYDLAYAIARAADAVITAEAKRSTYTSRAVQDVVDACMRTGMALGRTAVLQNAIRANFDTLWEKVVLEGRTLSLGSRALFEEVYPGALWYASKPVGMRILSDLTSAVSARTLLPQPEMLASEPPAGDHSEEWSEAPRVERASSYKEVLMQRNEGKETLGTGQEDSRRRREGQNGGPPDPAKESEVVGKETARAARLAIADILVRQPSLAALVEQTSTPRNPDRLQYIWSCTNCPNGQMHGIGKNRLPTGETVSGGLLVCDHCGYHERRR